MLLEVVDDKFSVCSWSAPPMVPEMMKEVSQTRHFTLPENPGDNFCLLQQDGQSASIPPSRLAWPLMTTLSDSSGSMVIVDGGLPSPILTEFKVTTNSLVRTHKRPDLSWFRKMC